MKWSLLKDVQIGKMLEKQLKQFVCTDISKTEQGFSLLSMLIIITILFATLPFLAHISKGTAYSSNYDELSILQFFNFLRDEFMLATDYSITSKQIVFTDGNGKRISFEKYNQLILRKVDHMGHDIYLRDVKDINFSVLPYGMHVEITSLEGETYEKTIIYYE
jgi:competence protein ComGF